MTRWRQEIIGDATLICGDCLQIALSDAPIDHIITDPPYEAEAHGAGRRLLSHQGTDRRSIIAAPLNFDAITDAQREQVAALGAAHCRGWFIAFCQAEAVGAWRDALNGQGASWRRAMVWIKPDSSPQLSGDRPAPGFESMACAWFGDGRSIWNGGGRRGVFTFGKHDLGIGHGGAGNEHPTQKPIALMDALVELFTQRGELVFDPFMGSGTTGMACLRQGRRFVGIEREPRYFDLACRRIEEAWKQPRLFEEPKQKPVQERLDL